MHPDTLGGIVIIVFGLVVWIAVCEHWRRERRRVAIAAAKRRHPSNVAMRRLQAEVTVDPRFGARPDAADRALAQYTQRAKDLGHTPKWTHEA